jgi:GH35 family endo-1,4-beta-xylanase
MALPDFIKEENDPQVLEAWIREHIRNVMTHYRGKIAQYDVANDPTYKSACNNNAPSINGLRIQN